MTRRPALHLAAGTCAALLLACGTPTADGPPGQEPTATSGSGTVPRPVEPEPQETHLAGLRMLTDGGENAEAYWSFDGRRLVFQSTREPFACDQIFAMDAAGGEPELVSTGEGRTTCAYFDPGDRSVIYASTHLGGPDCPPTPDFSRGYVWPLYSTYDIFRTDLASGELTRITDTPGYDAEATISPLGDRIVFTSMRDGDLDIYSMDLDGSDVVRLTDEVGYDGGPFYSPDGSKIVYRAHHPVDSTAIEDYRSLLREGLIRPSQLEIWIMDVDGGNKRQITDLGAAAFAPFFHPSGTKIIFSSNHHDPSGREFDLFMIGVDGTGLEQLTFSPGFDGFPMFSPDGSRLVFCSNRHNSAPGETNVFVADWVD